MGLLFEMAATALRLEMSWEEFIPAVKKELAMPSPDTKFLGATVKMLTNINLPNPAATVMCTSAMLAKEVFCRWFQLNLFPLVCVSVSCH